MELTEPMYWSGTNAQKPEGIAKTGYRVKDNPAAEHENYFRHVTYQCIKELQQILLNQAEHVQFAGDAENGFYFLDDDGNRLTGQVRITGVPYSFSAKGVLDTGWQTVFGKRYYYSQSDGNAVLGWLTYLDKKYYITLLDGKLVNQYRTIDGKDYHFDQYGVASEVS